MINQSGYFGFRRKRWIQLSGSKNTQYGQTTDLAEIWSPTWEGLTSLVEWIAGGQSDFKSWTMLFAFYFMVMFYGQIVG